MKIVKRLREYELDNSSFWSIYIMPYDHEFVDWDDLPFLYRWVAVSIIRKEHEKTAVVTALKEPWRRT